MIRSEWRVSADMGWLKGKSTIPLLDRFRIWEAAAPYWGANFSWVAEITGNPFALSKISLLRNHPFHFAQSVFSVVLDARRVVTSNSKTKKRRHARAQTDLGYEQ